MTAPPIPQTLAEPVAAITRLVLALEPGLEPAAVAEAVTAAAGHRPAQRQLAKVLSEDPDLLTSGRPVGPHSIEKLVRGLQQLGAQKVRLPACAHCGKTYTLAGRDGDKRICRPCSTRLRGAGQPCTRCGKTEGVFKRDAQNRPYCRTCPVPDEGQDPIPLICAHVRQVDPDLPDELIITAIRRAAAEISHQRRLARTLHATPGLLTGQGAHGTPRVLALIDALIDLGSNTVAAPSCPLCGRDVKLAFTSGQVRCCRRCYDERRTTACSRCHDVKPTSSRTEDGLPICDACYKADPFNHEACTSCGRIRLIARRTETERICKFCYTSRRTAICSVCGNLKPCYFADTDSPRCDACRDRLRPHEKCAACGQVRRIEGRDAAGGPLCTMCSARKAECAGCGKVTRVTGKSSDGADLCRTCYAEDPAGQHDCTRCGTHGRLYHRGLCQDCAAPGILSSRLARPDGTVRPELEPVAHALLNTAEISALLPWLYKTSVRKVLAQLGSGTGPVTHEVLDQLPHPRSIHHLRSILVAAGVLPTRDEHLARLENWIGKTLAMVENTEERRLLKSFAAWHHLRRLRRSPKSTTAGQDHHAREEITAAIALLTWLRGRERTLSTCTQADIDLWLSSGERSRYLARAFVLWTVKNHHARRIEIPAWINDADPKTLTEEQRWRLIRRLLHDEDIDLADRVAGLLVLLFAQRLRSITALTLDHVTRTATTTSLLLGTDPVELPPQIDTLVLQLAQRRAPSPAHSSAGTPAWLFPGARAGQPMTASSLMVRLQRHGIQIRPTRNAVMMDAAAAMPAVVLSKLLGVNIESATRWNKKAGTPGAAYAAELARRKGR